jgi:hypothetical protein
VLDSASGNSETGRKKPTGRRRLPDSKLFSQSLDKYRQFVKRNPIVDRRQEQRLLPKLDGIFIRRNLDQSPEVAQVSLGGKDVAQTDPQDCATVQLLTRKFPPANSGLVKI